MSDFSCNPERNCRRLILMFWLAEGMMPLSCLAQAAHCTTPCGTAVSIRTIRVKLLATIVSLKCWSTRLMPR